MIWLHSEEELNNFLLRLNSFHENIKYKWDISYQRVSFFDVSVRLDNVAFCTDVHVCIVNRMMHISILILSSAILHMLRVEFLMYRH